MELYISSYKLGNKTDFIKKWNNEHNCNNILLITNARDTYVQDDIEKNRVLEDIHMLECIGFNVEVLDLKKYFDNTNALEEKLKKYKAFCVIGGNVFVLRKAMELSGFDNFLIKKRNSDVLYIGYSAGSCVLSSNLSGLELVVPAINPYTSDYVNYSGLGFVREIIVPHYKSKHKSSKMIDDVIEYLEKNHLKYKTVQDGEVIIKNLNTMEC
ncbi:MAG: Type 1 glutamine amidotransferase-like domain-containing protein [Clostridia bacterium]|nr:Type 1 glutamine amidotransferase-like domain-containing protein [Clostridia bacterium]